MGHFPGCKFNDVIFELHSLDPLFKWVKPSEDRQRPYLLEMGLEIPGKTECFVEIEFQKLLLRWTEYPPDAHHGLAVPAAIVSFYSANYNNLTVPLGRRALISESLRDSSRSPWLVQIFGEILLVNLPTPDFSMPYNVICLVCTVMALAFGPLHNMTCKSLVLKSPAEIKKNSVKAKVRAVVEKVMRLLLRRKKEERKQNTAENEKIASENADISERQQTGPVGSPVEED